MQIKLTQQNMYIYYVYIQYALEKGCRNGEISHGNPTGMLLLSYG